MVTGHVGLEPSGRETVSARDPDIVMATCAGVGDVRRIDGRDGVLRGEDSMDPVAICAEGGVIVPPAVGLPVDALSVMPVLICVTIPAGLRDFRLEKGREGDRVAGPVAIFTGQVEVDSLSELCESLLVAGDAHFRRWERGEWNRMRGSIHIDMAIRARKVRMDRGVDRLSVRMTLHTGGFRPFAPKRGPKEKQEEPKDQGISVLTHGNPRRC